MVQQRILERERESSTSELLSALTSMRSEQAEMMAKVAELDRGAERDRRGAAADRQQPERGSQSRRLGDGLGRSR